MDLLEKSWLTPEEEHNHLEDMGVIAEQEKKAWRDRVEKNWLKNRPMEEEMIHVNVNKAWE